MESCIGCFEYLRSAQSSFPQVLELLLQNNVSIVFVAGGDESAGNSLFWASNTLIFRFIILILIKIRIVAQIDQVFTSGSHLSRPSTKKLIFDR